MDNLKVIKTRLGDRKCAAPGWAGGSIKGSFSIKGNSYSTGGDPKVGDKKVHRREDSQGTCQFTAIRRLVVGYTSSAVSTRDAVTQGGRSKKEPE